MHFSLEGFFMKFAHIADCHIGGWREPTLRVLGIQAFAKTIDTCIQENVAFVLLAGDLFDTALPSLELIKEVTLHLKKLADAEISCYLVPGSHDYAVTGRTMLDVLEHAGLIENVVKITENQDKISLSFTQDKTGVKITGLGGKRNNLEKHDYERLDKTNLEEEPGFKIFIFHGLLDEFKPEYLQQVDGFSTELLPKNFRYYAGGHPHFVFQKKTGQGIIAYPGALFPNNFGELEKFHHGGFYLIDVNEEMHAQYIPVSFKEVVSFNIDLDKKTIAEAEKIIQQHFNFDVTDKIVTLRFSGVLKGKISDLDFKKLLTPLDNAYVVLKNMQQLNSYESTFVVEGNIEDIE